MENKFEKELEQLINKYSKENDSNTPDFILAEYLNKCLETFNTTIQKRETWYGRNNTSSKRKDTTNSFEDEAIMLENEANDRNYHFYCMRTTLGIQPPVTPYQLLDSDYGRVRSASEKEAIREILMVRNVNCDTSNDAYNDWKITRIKSNDCCCDYNGKKLPNTNSIIEAVRVKDKQYEIGQTVKYDGIIEEFIFGKNNRVYAIVIYKYGCPMLPQKQRKTIDIVNLE